MVQESGEHVILTLGELHLARCVKELEERYAKIKISVSDPVVGFKETIVTQEFKSDRGKSVTIHTSSKCFAITLRAMSIPDDIRDFIIVSLYSCSQ